MAELVKDIIRWLHTVGEENLVGIDEGGLTLVGLDPQGEPLDPEVWYEIGGFGGDDEEDEYQCHTCGETVGVDDLREHLGEHNPNARGFDYPQVIRCFSVLGPRDDQ